MPADLATPEVRLAALATRRQQILDGFADAAAELLRIAGREALLRDDDRSRLPTVAEMDADRIIAAVSAVPALADRLMAVITGEPAAPSER